MKSRFVLIVLLSLTLSACLPQFNSGTDKNAGVQGQFLKAKAPKGFPSLPLYPKSKILESYGLSPKFGASAISGDSLSKVVDFYNTSLVTLGWEFKLRQVDTTRYIFDVKNQTQQGTVIVNTAADGKMTAITLSVGAR